MARKLSKKKIFKSKERRKLNKKHKKTKQKYKRKQRGGSRASRRLESSIRKVLREENNMGTEKPTKKKGIISTLLGQIPVIGNLISDPEVEKAQQLKEAQDKQHEEQMKKELEDSKTETVKRKEAMATEVKSTINDMTSRKALRPLTSIVGENTQKIKKNLVDKAVNKLYGVSGKVADTAQDLKKMATTRQCDAEFVTNLDKIIDTCGPEELVKVYNEVAQKILSKKQLYSPRLEAEMSKLPLLDYNPSIETEPELDLKGLAISPDNKDLIEDLQKGVEKKLNVAEKLKNLDSTPESTKKKKKKKKLILSNNLNQNRNSSEA